MDISGELPEIVTRALRSGLETGFVDTTGSETGRLLATIAAAVTGPIADCGTGCGVGAAWLRSGAPASVQVFTVESDETLAARADETFADDDITIIHGDWMELTGHGPFAMLNTDHALARTDDAAAMIHLLRPGGIAIIDGLAPRELVAYDPVRHRWLDDPRLVSTELPVSPDTHVIIAVRKAEAPSDVDVSSR